MAEVAQIYNFVNEVRKQAFGEKAVEVVDASSLVSLGDYIFNSSDNKNRDLYWSALVDKIGRTYAAVRKYEGTRRSVRRTPLEWGCIIEKVSYTIGDAVQNDTWIAGESDPFNVVGSITPTSKLFKSISTWERDQFVPDRQLKLSFTNAESQAAFVSGLFVSLDNALSLEIDRVTAVAVNSYMAECLADDAPNSNQARNLLTEYNTLTNRGLTINAAIMDKGFLKYASQQIGLVVDNMSSFSTKFNATGQQRHTPSDKVVVEVLSPIAKAFNSYLDADTYHQEMVKLPNYETIPYWQGSGDSFALADVSKIDMKIGTTEVSKAYIMAFVHDIDAVAMSAYDIRTLSIYNPKKEVTNYFKKADIGFMVDMSENGVVFYMAET